jgi:ATP-dependent DNA helicase RecQ
MLDHFGDSRAGEPTGRCCDVCDPDGWLPAPETIVIRRTRSRSRSPAPAVELSAADAELLDALKAWRLLAAAGKPAYTVAHNRTLEAIAASRPEGPDALARIHGIGPAFVSRHATEVLDLVATHENPAAGAPTH